MSRFVRFRTLRWLVLPILAVALIVSPDQVYAAFTATTTNSGNAFTAAAGFPDYPTAVTGDGAAILHRSDEAPSSSATSAAADAAGTSQPGVFNGKSNGPSTRWAFDEGSGTTAADRSGAANPGTLVNSPTWITGASGSALGFNGTTQYLTGAGPAVNTSASFTVAAWAYLSDNTAYRTVLSQDGTTVSGFYLQYHLAANRWCLNMLSSDADSAASDRACSTAAPNLNAWTHLAGVFDSVAGNIRLYVNGVLQATTAHAGAWNATGGLVAGAAKFSGDRRDHFTGRIDEARTYRRALSAAEITDLYGDNASLKYDFEENTGPSTADLSGNANTGTLQAGVAWTTAGKNGNAAQFSVSATDYVTSTTAPIDTTASFTVAAWVNLNTSGAVTRTIMSQQGTNYSTFILKYESGGEWAFMMTTNAGGTEEQAVTNIGAAYNTWVHVVAVHNTAAAAGSKMRLYVNNSLAASAGHATLYGTANPLQIGRARYAGAWVDPWDGEIDEVRTYRRALTTTEISDLYNGVDTAAPAPMTAGVPGALQGAQQGQQSSTAVAFNGTTNAYSALVAAPGPTDFTTECWFRTTSTTGGQLIGYTADATGLASTGRDRMVYLDSGNRLTFGIWWNNAPRTIRSPAGTTYNDGAWHHVATSYGPAGLKLYADGVLVAADPNYTQSANPAGNFAGYWRWGGGQVNWANTNAPVDDYLTGTLDEVSVTNSQLSDQQIARHYHANH